ncbi:MAG TPA: STAS/SEC14 domain-containing protein [Balneolaceae bacterium]|nr:STAS/SEC14 domain-containing protein [Balneolaceae bacterium]
MAINFNEENDGKILVIHVSGRLVRKDYLQLIPKSKQLIRKHGKIRILFDMTDFQGWDEGAVWEDIKLGMEHFSDVERIAMVGEEHWQQDISTFSKPFTRAKIRYFDHTDMDTAYRWLTANIAPSAH